MQTSLDLNNHYLLYNGQRLYCPAVIDNIITFDTDVSIPNMYTKSDVDGEITSLSTYLDTQFYNKEQVDALIAGGGTPIDAYTKAETDDLLALKANSADVYTKSECDEKY